MRITPEQFIEHWTVNKKAQPFVNHFERAIFDFTTKAGQYTEGKFKSSFDSGRFIGAGSPWKPCTPRWAARIQKKRKRAYVLMQDMGKLKSGIDSNQPRMSESFIEQPPSPGHRRVYRKGSYYFIKTNARSQVEKRIRGNNPYSNNSYAAIHNTDPKFGLYRVNKWSTKSPEHRQFIGFHPIIDEHVRQLIPDIFDIFPLH